MTVNAAQTQASIVWQQSGPAQVCAQGTTCPNAPELCIDINIGEVVYTDEETYICQGKTTTCAGKTFAAPGNFPVVLKADSGCDSIVTCKIKLIPTVTTTEIYNLCQSPPGTVSCAGQEFSTAGLFPVTLTTDLGCDSIVRCSIRLVPTTFSPFTFVNLCGPNAYKICDNTLTETAIHSEVCENYLGCDSIVNVNLAIMEPQAIIAPPEILDCDSNLTVTIIGSASPPNNAPGGITLYNWTGPGIVGAFNQPNVQVNQPGQYCLTVTHARGGVYCADTTCITVLANSAIPPLPIISGNPNPCGDSTVIYAATANGNPPPTSFVWTTKNNTPITTLGFDSIQITWTNVVLDTLCVTANNSCGASSPACIPINVLQPIVSPQMTGPATVCTNGGAYLFTLDTQQIGVNYNWVVPAGAVFTGSGDSISVDFTNATSGQVCVTASNVCGSIPPVCRNVLVSPAPSVDLSSSVEICLGESVDLTFTLSGNGPFDVVWSDGNQTTTLNNISNGHVVPVNPLLTTTYSLVSVADNTVPNACVTASSDNVTVTVWNPATTNQSFVICQGESMLLGGANQTTSGVYYDTLNTLHGCDSIIISALTVNVIDTTIIVIGTNCDPALAGYTTQILSQTNGCDSVVITSVNLLPTDSTALFTTSCDPTNVGVFVQNLTNQWGCDSTVTTTVTYSDSYTTNLTDATCDPAGTGVFSVTLQSVEGCDSIIITTVTLLASDTTLLFGASCNPSEVGVFVQDLTNQNGCDSTVFTTISFFHLDTTQLTAASCDPGATGVFFQTLVTADGCDSVLMTTVSLLASDTTYLSAADCDPANVGTFMQVLTNQNGCDSTVITTVSLLPSNTTALSGQSCNPVEVGTFVQDLTNQYGCDSIVTTTVSFFAIPPTPLTSTTCDPAMVGVFSQTLVTAAGCDSTLVTTVSLLPSNTTSLSGQSCNPAEVGTFIQDLTNQYGCDSIVTTTVTFFAISPTPLTATTCDPAMAGVFSETLVTAAGCDSTLVTTVTLLPSNTVSVQSTTCDPNADGVFVYNLTNQYGCDSIVTETVLLLPSNTTNIALSTCDAASVGVQTTVLTNQFGCDSTVITTTSLLPPANCGAQVSVVGSNIPCASTTGTLTLTATLGIPPFQYDVRQGGNSVATGSVNALNTPQVVSGLPAGTYTVVITASTGYSATAQATVVQLLPPVPGAVTTSDYGGFSISCEGGDDGTAQVAVSGGLPPYTYAWSSGSTSVQATGLAADTYTLTVTDANNCTTTATATLTEPEPVSIAFLVTDITCFGRRDGTITVQASGGIPPYRYSLNGGGLQASNVFSGLSSGVFAIRVEDASGCESSETIVVNAPPPFEVELNGPESIAIGDSATLEILANVPADSIQSIIWGPPLDTTDCTVCFTQGIAPFVTTTYSVTVVTTGGCSDDDKITVFVDRRRYLYVPNVFSPNGDGENDIFTVFAKPNTVKNIKTMQLFNRWGEAVFQLNDFQPNNPNIGWDGTFRGKPMNPAVFAWMIEVEFIDGVVEVYSGDVTISR